MPGTNMTYGDYPLVPAPFMRLQRVPSKGQDGRIIGLTWNATLNGSLVAYPSSSLVTIDTLQDEMAAAFSEQGQLFHLDCNDTTLLECYPRIGELNFEDGIWVDTCKYSLNMEWDALPSGITEYITEFSEEWNFEPNDERGRFVFNTGSYEEIGPSEFKLTHTVNVTGKTTYNSGEPVKLAWEEARDFIVNQNILGLDLAAIADKTEGIYGITASDLSSHKHMRTVSVNERGGSYGVTESWILLDSDREPSGMAVEDFTINIKQSIDSALTNVSVEGTLQGLETISYTGTPYEITETRWEAVQNHWSTIKDKLYHRCNYSYQANRGNTDKSLNLQELNYTIGQNPKAGVITYSKEFDDRPPNCLSGARLETFSITDNNPTDIYTIINIPGKSGGPLFQDIGTQTEGTRTLNIEAVFEPTGVCPTTNFSAFIAPPSGVLTEVAAIKSAFEDDFTNNNYSWFVAQNDQGWEPKSGKFTRTLSWKYSRCDS